MMFVSMVPLGVLLRLDGCVRWLAVVGVGESQMMNF